MTDEQIIAAYLAGDDPETVAFAAGVHAATVLKILRAHDVPLRPARRGRRYSLPITQEEICRRYKAGESGPALAREARTSEAHIYGILRRAGVERRSAVHILKKQNAEKRAARMGGKSGKENL